MYNIIRARTLNYYKEKERYKMTRMKRVLAAVLAALSLSLVTVLAADSIYLNTRQIKWHSDLKRGGTARNKNHILTYMEINV